MAVPISRTIISALTSNSPPALGSGNLEFVHISNPSDINNRTNQRAIRQHVMREVSFTRRRRRRPISYTFDIVQDESLESYHSAKSEGGIEYNIQQHHHRERIDSSTSSAYITRDLYLEPQFPIKTTPRILALINFSHRDAAINYRPAFRCWFGIALTDPSAFYMTLSNSAYELAHMQNSHSENPSEHQITDDYEALEFYTLSVQAVQKRLQNSVDDGVLGAILGFACMDVVTGNFARSSTHLQGLDRVIQLRGGFDTVVSRDLRLTLLNIDVCTSLAQDIPPLFPAPLNLLQDFPGIYLSIVSPTLKDALQRWETTFPNCTDFVSAVMWTGAFSRFIDGGAASSRFWREENTTYYMLFVLHHVLCIERQDIGLRGDEELLMREVIRLALLVFLSDFKLRLGLPCGENKSGDMYRGKIKALMQDNPLDWSPFCDFQLWILIVCVAGQQRGSSEWAWSVNKIGLLMLRMGLTSWASVMEIIRGYIWINDLPAHNVHALGDEVGRMFGDILATEL